MGRFTAEHAIAHLALRILHRNAALGAFNEYHKGNHKKRDDQEGDDENR